MGDREHTIQFLLEQQRRWPNLQVQDLLKGLHQSVFGNGHFVTEDGRAYLRRELAEDTAEDRGLEPLDGPWVRFHLSHLPFSGITEETLYRLFVLSGKYSGGDTAELEQKLTVLLELAEEGRLLFGAQKVRAAIDRWRDSGFQPCHHSPAMWEKSHPAYRVLHQDCARLLPLLARIDRLLAEQGGGIVAVEGGSASGKTTLAAVLQELYDCSVFHMDDFFLRPEQRTAERLAQPGGNVDRERFLEEVLLPVTRGETVRLQRYDCRTQTVQPPVEQAPKALTIVEGAYSMHPELAEYYDCSAFLSVEPQLQRDRIAVRNTPELQEKFFSTWIPLEQRYFEATDTKKRCDLILEVQA